MRFPRWLWWITAGVSAGAALGAVLGAVSGGVGAFAGDGNSGAASDAGISAFAGLVIGAVGGSSTALLSLVAKGILDPVRGGASRRSDSRIAATTAGTLASIASLVVLMDDSESLGVRLLIAIPIPIIVAFSAGRSAAWIHDRTERAA